MRVDVHEGATHGGYCCKQKMLWSFSISCTDILAIGLLFVSCISIGEMEKMRDSLARVLPWWTEDMALYPHIFSL